MNKQLIKYLNLIFLIVLVFVLFSCSQETTVDLGNPTQRLVVEGRIEYVASSENPRQEITLSQIGDFFENQDTPRAIGAEVWVTNAANERFDFDEEMDGQYVNSGLSPTIDETYVLHIVWEGQEYEAMETLIAVPAIDTIYQRFEEGNLFEDEGIKIAIDFTDPAEVDNYYHWETFLDGELQILPDPGNKNNLIAEDDFFNGNQIVGYFPNEEVVFDPGNEVLVRQIGLSENAFTYYYTLFDQAAKTGALIDTPPIPVRGNIRNLTNPSNYALGYFYACEVAEARHIVQ